MIAGGERDSGSWSGSVCGICIDNDPGAGIRLGIVTKDGDVLLVVTVVVGWVADTQLTIPHGHDGASQSLLETGETGLCGCGGATNENRCGIGPCGGRCGGCGAWYGGNG